MSELLPNPWNLEALLGLAWLAASRGDPTGGLLPLFHLPTSDLLVGSGIAVALGLVQIGTGPFKLFFQIAPDFQLVALGLPFCSHRI